MAEEPTQETPQGATIPVPGREDVLRFFRRASGAPEPSSSDDGDAGSTEDEQ